MDYYAIDPEYSAMLVYGKRPDILPKDSGEFTGLHFDSWPLSLFTLRCCTPCLIMRGPMVTNNKVPRIFWNVQRKR